MQNLLNTCISISIEMDDSASHMPMYYTLENTRSY